MSITHASAAKIREFDAEKCVKWARTPTVNPRSGYSIEANKATYNAIAKHCRDAFRTFPTSPPGADVQASLSAHDGLAKRVGFVVVPHTTAEWETSEVRTYINRMYTACRKYGIITEKFAHIANDSIQVISHLIAYDIIPNSERPKLAKATAYLKDFISNPDNIKKVDMNRNLCKQHADISILELLLNQIPDMTSAKIREELLGAEFHSYMVTGNAAPSDDCTDMLIALEGLENDIVLMRADVAAPGNKGAAAAYALPDSRERSLPESISQRRVKHKKPRREGADATAADEYYPWSATEEAAPTERSRFRSHAKLSAVSPGPAPSPGAASLPPLTPKKRTALLTELRAACTIMKDMISMQRFDRMNKKALQLVVRLGKPAAGPEQERCYYVKNLYQLWATAAKDNKPFRDPLTRAPINRDEKDDIIRKVRYLRPNAPDPRNHTVPRDKNLTLEIKQVYARARASSGSSDNEDRVGFYSLSVKRQIGKYVYLIEELGYVPSDIELADVGGDANLTSSAVIGNIQALFESGRLMLSNVIPYRCCRIHMYKTLKYWLAKTSHSPAANSVNLRRWKMMATEVYDHL